jgi:NADPH:quinone reductase-like Zn-dependent oxidoreductase
VALVGITAHLGLVRDAKLRAGETIFVNGGSGGVGSMVTQMAKAIGAKVVTTAGADTKVKKCHALGADFVINYKTQDVEAEVRRFASGGVNVFWETLREPDFDKAVAMMAPRGRMILIHQPLGVRRQDQAAYRSRDAAFGSGGRPQAARRKHDRQSGHVGREDCAQAVGWKK